MNCASGGFPTLRHNELVNFTAAALTEVCHDVAIEPVLQPLYGESANVEDEVRLDVSCSEQGFWGNRHQNAFFDTKNFNLISLLLAIEMQQCLFFINGLSVTSNISMSIDLWYEQRVSIDSF